MARTWICCRTAWVLFAAGVFARSAMAQDLVPEPSAAAPRSDQRRLRILLSAGPLPDESQSLHTGATVLFRIGTHTSAFAAIEYDWPSQSRTICSTFSGRESCYRSEGLTLVTSQVGFRFLTQPYDVASWYFTVGGALLDGEAPGMAGGMGIEFPIRGRTRGFVGAQMGAFGGGDWGVGLLWLKVGVNFGVQ